MALAGCTVPIDAMGTQANIAQAIRDRGTDYVLAVKENQPKLAESMQISGTVSALIRPPIRRIVLLKASKRVMDASKLAAAGPSLNSIACTSRNNGRG